MVNGEIDVCPSFSFPALSKRLTKIRSEFHFLTETSQVTQQQTVKRLSEALFSFSRGSEFPKFKTKKRNVNSLKIVGDIAKKEIVNKFYFPFLGFIKFKNSVNKPINPSSYTVSRSATGKWYVNFILEAVKEKGTQKGRCGIDLGLSTFATLADNQGKQSKVENPKWYRKSQRKRTRLQRRLARKQMGSANREKQRLSLARFEETVTNQRKDFLHKLSTKLVSTYRTISVEDLNIRGMLKNHCLALSVSDASWGEFLRQLEYKAQRFVKPIQIIRVDRWFPSTRTCSACKAKREVKLRLSERKWECPSCGVQHDRDINAAVNLLLAAR